MRKNFVLFFSLLLIVAGLLIANQAREKEAVEKAVFEGYIQGIFLKGDAELVRKRWHKECDIVVYRDGKLQIIPVTLWIERLEKQSGPPLPDTKVTYEFDDVKVVGNAALAVVYIFFDGKQKYTDFMNLYKFDSGWKIVTKTFYSHF